MISFFSSAGFTKRGFEKKFQIAMISIYCFVPRFDPVKVHCILPDLAICL
jgi:hypothetical protein